MTHTRHLNNVSGRMSEVEKLEPDVTPEPGTMTSS
jgi:hypothetical protein